MSYVQKNLLPGETILYTGRLHWIVYAKPMLVVLLGVAVIVASPFAPNLPKLWIWGGVAVVVGLLAALPILISVWSTELVVTSVRVVAKHGVISRTTMEMLHKRIESISVHQSIPGRLLNFGTLVLQGTGGGREGIPTIAHPLEFRNAAMAAQSESWKH
jgi:uncharacterized membrane protein YdbT with pleckstrin-like domain